MVHEVAAGYHPVMAKAHVGDEEHRALWNNRHLDWPGWIRRVPITVVGCVLVENRTGKRASSGGAGGNRGGTPYRV